MSYKCAIFGHRFGDLEVERDRTEEGNEVVTTIRETETCVRCDETRIVSENKEVTTLETAADIVADDLAGAEADELDAGGGAGGRTEAQPTADEPPITEAEPTGPERHEYPDPADEDAVILDDEDERDPGEWPEPPASADDTDGPETAHGADDVPSWELPDDIEPHPQTEERSVINPDPDTGSSVTTTGDALTVPEGEFYCPACGFTTPVESSSLRAGDFCPACHQTTLEHRPE